MRGGLPKRMIRVPTCPREKEHQPSMLRVRKA